MSEATYHFSTVSNITNTTDYSYYDPFCTDMQVGHLVWAGFCVLCAVLGMPASIQLLWGLSRKGCAGLFRDVYMLNLACTDLIFNIFNIPGMLNIFFWKEKSLAITMTVLYCLNLSCRPLLMACVCVDCYLAVVHPIAYMKMKRGRYRLVACASVWVFSLIYGLAFALRFHLSYISVFAMPYVLSLPVIAFCDVTVLLALRKPDPSGRTDIHPQKQRALQTITNSLVMSTVAYLPPLVVLGFSPLLPLPSQHLLCDVLTAVLIGPFLGSTIMPLLHLHNMGYLKGCSH